ncbi:MAG: PEP/pyruvate-binding domain-containing protein, partial [Candidatus Woesearchaeota archaeon]
MANVVWFKELNKNSISVAGGKGANLGEMTNANIPVPYGFIVTAQAYGNFIEKTKIKQKILDIVQNLNVEDNDKLQQASKDIEKIITTVEMPSDIKNDILKYYEELCKSNCFVAVRSSATAEDLPEASFAGQQATFLNIKGKENLIKAVRDCWASLYTARAIYYRTKNNFPHEKVLIAVVVQKMVNSEISGIMFTANPATNNADEIVIEAAWGLGEAVVSGSVNPDLYIVDKKNFNIKKKELKRQLWGLFRDEKGGNVKKYISEEVESKQVLPDEKIIELAKIGKRLEDHYNKPQDIEWAGEANELLIVQTRAITTLGGKPQVCTTTAEAEECKILVKGETASAGIASGSVKIIHGPEELDKIQKGDILVTEMTNPDMVPAMQRAAAIVTDEGGLTCIEGDARLFTNKGFVKFKEIGNLLEKGDELKTLSLDSKTKKVVWRKILLSMKRKAKTLEIAPYLHPTNKLEDKIKITPDHKMPILEGNILKSLQLKDLIENKQNLFVVDKIPKLDKKIDLEIFDKHKLMYLCGLIFSDGHIVKRDGKPMRVMFSQKVTEEKKPYINIVLNYFHDIFNANLENYTVPSTIVSYKGSELERTGSFECSQAYSAQTLQNLKDNFVQVISSIDEEYVSSFLAGIIDGDGHFSKQKSSIEIYVNKNQTSIVDSIIIACLRLNSYPEVSQKGENLIVVKIKDNISKITEKCTRVKATEKKGEDRKLFDPKVFKSLELKDWRGNLYNYLKKEVFIGPNWLLKYLEGQCEDEKLSQIKELANSDLRMQRLMVIGETEPIDVYNVAIDAETEEDHNYIIFTEE